MRERAKIAGALAPDVSRRGLLGAAGGLAAMPLLATGTRAMPVSGDAAGGRAMSW